MYRFMTITLSLCALLFGASLAVAAPEVPGDLRLVPPETIKATKAPVDFSHARHGAAQVGLRHLPPHLGRRVRRPELRHPRLSRPARQEGRERLLHGLPLQGRRQQLSELPQEPEEGREGGPGGLLPMPRQVIDIPPKPYPLNPRRPAQAGLPLFPIPKRKGPLKAGLVSRMQRHIVRRRAGPPSRP